MIDPITCLVAYAIDTYKRRDVQGLALVGALLALSVLAACLAISIVTGGV